MKALIIFVKLKNQQQKFAVENLLKFVIQK